MKNVGIAKVTYSTGFADDPFKTEKVKHIENEWVSSLEKSVENGTFLYRRRKRTNKQFSGTLASPDPSRVSDLSHDIT